MLRGEAEVPAARGADSTAADLATPRLRATFSWTLAGNVIYAASQWGLMVATARYGTPELVGRYAFALAVAAPVFLFAGLNLRALQITRAVDGATVADFLGVRALAVMLAIIVVMAIMLLGRYQPTVVVTVALVGATKSVDALSEVLHGTLHSLERMDLVARSQMVKGPLVLVAFAAVLAHSANLRHGLLAVLLVGATVLLALDVYQVRHAGGAAVRVVPRFSPSVLQAIVTRGVPLGAVVMLLSLATVIPRYVVERFAGERELGLFAAVTYVNAVGATIMLALGQSAVPKLAMLHRTGNVRGFLRLVRRLVEIGLCAGMGAVAIVTLSGEWLLSRLYSPEYADAADGLVIVTVAGMFGFVASFLGYAVTAARCFREQVPLFVLVAFTSTLASVHFIPRHGWRGGAWALLVAAVVQCVGLMFILSRAVRISRAEAAA